jgi:hypothetical protein
MNAPILRNEIEAGPFIASVPDDEVGERLG